MENMIELQNAFGQWVQDQDNNKWIVYNEANDKLGEFPKTWDEHDVMTAIRFGRTYELKAFNTGIQHGKEIQTKMFKAQLDAKDGEIAWLKEQNESLAAHLDRFAGADD